MYAKYVTLCMTHFLLGTVVCVCVCYMCVHKHWCQQKVLTVYVYIIYVLGGRVTCMWQSSYSVKKSKLKIIGIAYIGHLQ